MTPYVGRRKLHGRVLADPIVLELDAGAPHVQLLPAALLPLLLEGDDEEVRPQVEVGLILGIPRIERRMPPCTGSRWDREATARSCSSAAAPEEICGRG